MHAAGKVIKNLLVKKEKKKKPLGHHQDDSVSADISLLPHAPAKKKGKKVVVMCLWNSH